MPARYQFRKFSKSATPNNLGFVIVGIFLATWVVSYIFYRTKHLDEVEVR